MARLWFEKAAESGNTSACIEMAAAYLAGDGLEKDRAQGSFWLMLAVRGAAKSGNPMRPALEHRLSLATAGMARKKVAALVRQAEEWVAKHWRKTTRAEIPIRSPDRAPR
jgi:TPR repeat protein